MKHLFIATDANLGQGGIQTWAYYIIKLFHYKNLKLDAFIVNRTGRLRRLINILRINNEYESIILMDINKIKYLPVTLLLNLLGFQKNKIILLIHGDEILSLSGIKKSFVSYILKNINIKIIANSNSTSKSFLDKFHIECDNIYHPFIDCKIDYKYKENIKKNEYTIFTVSRLVKRKNIENVILAVEKLIQKKYNIKYFIAGDGPEYNRLSNLIKEMNLNEKIHMLGKISEDKKLMYLANCDLFVLPSIFIEGESMEGFGIVFIEANIFGVPVISGNSGGMKEAVVENITGFYSDGTVHDIMEKIEMAMRFNFSKDEIKKHSLKFDYRNQDNFLKIIMGD